MAFRTALTSAAGLALALPAIAQNGSGSHGPPPNAHPLTYGFYATPEIQQPVELEVTGIIPPWISGSLYRGAAVTWDTGNYTAEHWFDGFSRTHRFEIANSTVSYRSRNASDEVMDFVKETGKYPGGSFGSDPCKAIFGAFETTFRDGQQPHGNPSSNSVGIFFIANFPGLERNTTSPGGPFVTLVTTIDANVLQQLDPVTLEPIEIFTYQASNEELVDSGRSATHPAYGADGSIFNYVLDTSTRPPEYRVFALDKPTGTARILTTVTDAPPAYLHTLFSTEKHLLLIVLASRLRQTVGLDPGQPHTMGS